MVKIFFLKYKLPSLHVYKILDGSEVRIQSIPVLVDIFHNLW